MTYLGSMRPDVPTELLSEAADWKNLHQWERKQLGLALRRLGLTFGEIREIVPVPKSTLSNWCHGVQLSPEDVAAIRSRTGPGSRRGIPVDTQWRRREDITHIRAEARRFAASHLDNSAFVAGVVLYWGEGSKSRNYIDLVNSDPRALRLFTAWIRRFLDPNPEFVLALHLHAGNDEAAAIQYWREQLEMPDVAFTKTFIKPPGTGHRKNHLPHGVCRVRLRRASDSWHRVMEWIDVVAEDLNAV